MRTRLAVLLAIAVPLAIAAILIGCDDPISNNNGGGLVLRGVWDVTLISDPPAAPICDGSALGAAVPASKLGVLSGNNGGSQWHSVVLRQNGAQVTGVVAEQHVLSAHAFPPPLGAIAIGDTITVSYRRALDADGRDGDMFRAIVVNGPNNLDLEYGAGDAMTSPDLPVTLTFTATSPIIRVDFIGGLSSAGESILIDDVNITNLSTAVVLLNEGFETGPALDCGPLNLRLEARRPEWEVGSLCVSPLLPLAGAFSARWEGGARRQLNGYAISGGQTSSLLSMIGMGSGAITGMLGGLQVEAWEPDVTDFFDSFAAISRSRSLLVGTFKGEAFNHGCSEKGTLQATLHRTHEADVSSSYWVINLEGQANNCVPPPLGGTTVDFDQIVSIPPGDTTDVGQSGSFVSAGAIVNPILDDYGNGYLLFGAVAGNAVTFTLADVGGGGDFTAIGTIANNQMTGVIGGTIILDAARVCEIVDGGSFTVQLVAKP